MNTATISGRIKAGAAFADPARYGRSDRSAMSRWFWEIDKVLLVARNVEHVRSVDVSALMVSN